MTTDKRYVKRNPTHPFLRLLSRLGLRDDSNDRIMVMGRWTTWGAVRDGSYPPNRGDK